MAQEASRIRIQGEAPAARHRLQELLIEGLSLAAFTSDKTCTIDHFSEAFSKISGFPKRYSPFTIRNYEDNFDQAKILNVIERARKKNSPGRKAAASK
ncbi:MAG: hypothetical protein JJU08_12170 [Rhodobacteraceae bacterium]|nr:hypothetical protein [Paracoccaceae bacterium]